MKDIDVLWEAMQKRKQKEAFAESLKENPLQESEYKSLILDMDLEPTHSAKMFSQMAEYKKKGLVIDDIPLKYDEFVSKVNEETDGKVMPMKLSIYKQLSGDELKLAHSVKLAFYDDVGCGVQGKVQHYTDKYGLEKSYVGQEVPAGSRTMQLDLKDPENIKKFNQASRGYDTAMGEWEKKKTSILKHRGERYEAWHPLPEAYQPKEEGAK